MEGFAFYVSFSESRKRNKKRNTREEVYTI